MALFTTFNIRLFVTILVISVIAASLDKSNLSSLEGSNDVMDFDKKSTPSLLEARSLSIHADKTLEKSAMFIKSHVSRKEQSIAASFPTLKPTSKPTLKPTSKPTLNPIKSPTTKPSSSLKPSKTPTKIPQRSSPPSVGPTLAPTNIQAANSMVRGQTLQAGQTLISDAGGYYKLEMGMDGNLYIYSRYDASGRVMSLWPCNAAWSLATYAGGLKLVPLSSLTFDRNGNLNLVSPTGQIIWTAPSGGDMVYIQTDRNLVIVKNPNNVVWNSRSACSRSLVC